MAGAPLPSIVGLAFAGFCSAHDEFAAEKFAVVEFFDGSLCFLKSGHQHEPKALGSIGFAMGNDFGVAHRAHPFEELKEIVLGGVKGEIAHVEFG